MSVTVDGAQVRLTRREFELLKYLVENRNRVLSRDRLLERVWGYERMVETRSVDVHVGRLRGKLGVAGQQIETWSGWATGSWSRSRFVQPLSRSETGLAGEMQQRAFDAVPVVVADDPNDAAVLLLAHFPPG